MIENRRDYRIPFKEKFIFSTPDGVFAGNGVNISKGGAFISVLGAPAIKTGLNTVALFKLRANSEPIRVNAKLKRVIGVSTNPESIPGYAFEFVDLPDSIQNELNKYLEEARKNYEVIATILSSGEPELLSLKPLLKTVQLPQFSDLGELRFNVERILSAIELVEKNS